jgi:heme oxygenase (biliverdin-producing, ferredoxin)
MASTVALSERQRQHTRRIHSLSGTLVAGKLLLVLTDRALYGRAISCFYPIVCALEELLASNQAKPHMEQVYAALTPISRCDALRADLQFLMGESWEASISRTPAVEEYLAVLDEVNARDPLLLTAYFYGLYIAFAAGGQILRRRIRKILELPEGHGTAFFEFDQGADVVKASMKEMFNALGRELDEPTIQKLLDESTHMFKLNNKVIASFPVTTQDVLATLRRLAAARWMLPVYVLLVACLIALLVASSSRVSIT